MGKKITLEQEFKFIRLFHKIKKKEKKFRVKIGIYFEKKIIKSLSNLQVALFTAPALFPLQKAKSKLPFFSNSGSDIFCTRADWWWAMSLTQRLLLR